MRYIKSGLLLASAAAVLAISACDTANDSQSSAQVAQGPAAATVNGKTISQNTVDMLVEQGAGSGRPDTPETRQAIIDQLTVQMVIADEAIKQKLDTTPEVIEQLEVIKQSVLANAYVRDFIENNPVSDEMLNAEYERIKATMTGDQYKASHILVDEEAEAKEIIAKLNKDPATFAQLATDRSKDPGSAVNGGDLGWFDLNRMVPEFGAAVSQLEPGKFTEVPVQTQFGYHVILLEDVRPIEPPPLEDVAPQLTQQLQQQVWEEQLETLKAAANIQIAGESAAAPDPAETAEPGPE